MYIATVCGSENIICSLKRKQKCGIIWYPKIFTRNNNIAMYDNFIYSGNSDS